MRWPFGRSSRPVEGSTTPASGAGDRPAVDRPHDAWRSLPAVQRATGEPPTVAPAGPFAASLATRQPPALALAPLGHEVSPLGSPGIVVGLAAPAGAALSGRVELPVQRHPVEAGQEPLGSAGWSSFDSPGPALDSGAAGAPDLPRPAAIAGQPVVIQRLAHGAPAMTSSTAANVPAAPAGTFDLRPAAPPPASRSTSPALPAVQPTAIQPSPATAAPVSNDLPARRPTLGQARRLGLGVPLASTSEHVVQRTALPAAAPASGGGQALPTSGAAISGPSPAAGGATGAAPGLSPAGGSQVSVVNESGAATSRREPAALTVVRPISIQRLAPALPGGPADVGPSGRPVVAGGIGLAAPSGGREPSAGELGLGTQPGPAGTRPDELGDTSPTVQLLLDAPLGGLPIRVSSAGPLIEPAAISEPGRSGALQADRTVPGTGPVVARSVADASRPIATAVRPSAAGGAVAGRGSRTETGGPTVLRMAASARPPTAVLDPGPAPVLATTGLPVQRAVEINELQIHPNVTDPSAIAGSSNGSTGGQDQQPGVGAAASPVDKDRELDDLARRLYSRIRGRLSAELLADRERAGIITDLR